MNKYFFIAIAAVGLFSACSSHDDDFATNDSVGGNVISEDARMPIKLSFGQEVTRGTGTVGGGFKDIQGTTEDNFWAGQSVTIFMTEKNTLKPAEFNGVEIFNHEEFIAPQASFNVDKGTAYPANDSVRYYPSFGAFDFWGYRLDDAVQSAPVTNATNDTTSIDFTINGTQDIMVAKAIPSTQDTLDVIGYSTVNNNPIDATEAGKRIYSAYAARAGVQPEFKFCHLLSRLKFYVKAGQFEAKDINIDSIKVISPISGKLIVAHLGNENEIKRIVWETATDSLTLMQRDGDASNPKNANLVDLVPVHPSVTVDDKSQWDPTKVDSVGVGEAILVAPGIRNSEDPLDDKYNITIFMSQPVRKYYNPSEHINPETGAPYTDEENVKKETYSNVSKAISRVLEAGKSYNILITVYGLSEIDVTTTLVPWEDGEGFTIIPEDEGFDN